MSFLENDEFLLLMVHCEDRAVGFENLHILTTQERARLREVGIQTAHEQPAWSRIEPSKGNFDIDYLNTIIQRNRDAGLKSLIQVSGWRVPKWVPNEWRARRKDGHYEEEQLSLWNKEAQDYSDNYYDLMSATYTSQKDVAFFFGEFQGGEGAYPPTWCLYDDAAIEDYKKTYGTSEMPIPDDPLTLEWYGNKIIEHFIRKTEILYPYYKEIWNEQQYLMDTWSKAFGNFVQADILATYRQKFPDASIVLLQYTYFDQAHDDNNVKYVDMLREISGCEVIAEAMFCKGLPITTPKSILKGFRGQIVHPVNEPGQTGLEDWMVNNIRDSHNSWLESKNK